MRESYSKQNSMMANPHVASEDNFLGMDSTWKNEIRDQAFQDEREFYLKKFKEIEHLCEGWRVERSSSELIEQIRKIILVAPAVDWCVEEG